MFAFLFSLKGNAKSCIWTEPLWGIPFNLYTPFFTVYMFSLGILDAQIGILITAGRLVQMIAAIFGGVLTDKFGRRLTTFVGDFISWSIPALIWAFSQNFWWFLAAALINGMWQITGVSWECLWVDEVTDESKLAQFFNWLYIAGLLAVFFAPISGFFVEQNGVVPVMRVLFIITFFSFTAKFVILYIFSKETKRGLERMEATKDSSIFQLLKGYGGVFGQIMRSRPMLRAMALQTLISIMFMITSTFFALYATQNLGLADSYLAYFPILRAGVMLAFFFVIQNRLNIFKPQNVMRVGILVYLAANVLLIFSPPGYWIWLAVYAVVEACASALLLPRVDTLAAHAIDPKERARIRSLMNAIILAVSSPFGLLAGQLSGIDRRFPFVMNVAIFLLMALILAFNIKSNDSNNSSEGDTGNVHA